MTRRLATLAGAGGALVSLWNDAPVNIAVLRGAGAYFGLILVAKIASAFMAASDTNPGRKSPVITIASQEDEA